MLIVRRLLGGLLSLGAAGFCVPSAAAANPPPARAAANPAVRSARADEGLPLFARDEVARPDQTQRLQAQSLAPRLPFQTFTPGIEPTNAFNAIRIGGFYPYGNSPFGSPIDGPMSSLGCNGWNSSYQPDILALDQSRDPYLAGCTNRTLRMLQNMDAPPALVPGHNPDALYGPAYKPTNIME